MGRAQLGAQFLGPEVELLKQLVGVHSVEQVSKVADHIQNASGAPPLLPHHNLTLVLLAPVRDLLAPT